MRLAYLLAIATLYGHTIEIDASPQASATACGQVPRNGIKTRFGAGSGSVRPHIPASKVEDLDEEVAVATRQVVRDKEVGARKSGVLTHRNMEEGRLQTVINHEVQTGGAGVVQRIPRPEGECMVALT